MVLVIEGVLWQKCLRKWEEGGLFKVGYCLNELRSGKLKGTRNV